uniref:hypothetical protein n=1 Tax=Nitrospira cf. moscoviensis SBR1015 TaxID=96242 RepID=UPI0011226098|nr:hypothetical protein [Nitrospira cf. moscoviensis SBR1015]
MFTGIDSEASIEIGAASKETPNAPQKLLDELIVAVPTTEAAPAPSPKRMAPGNIRIVLL